LGSMVLRSP